MDPTNQNTKIYKNFFCSGMDPTEQEKTKRIKKLNARY